MRARARVLAPARVAAGLIVQLEQDEIEKTAAEESPAGGEAGDTAADDDDGDADGFDRARADCAVTNSMTASGSILDETAFDAALGFLAEADERGAEGAPAYWAMRPHSWS
jgi:hypothetical protein